MTPSRKFFIVGLVILITVATHTLWLPLPAEFLAPADNIKKADAIVVLSGDCLAGREEQAIELYKQGQAGRIIRVLEVENIPFLFAKKVLKCGITQGEAYKSFFESKGVPADALIIAGEVATSTFDELGAVKDIVSKNNFRSIILVTSAYHMRRALMTARWVFRSSGIKIYNAAMRSKDFSPKNWWLSEHNTKEVVLEYLSLLLYVTYHFALGK